MEPLLSSEEPGTQEQTDVAVDVDVRLIPPYNVVLLDDNDHTYEYVIEMLRAVFGFTPSGPTCMRARSTPAIARS